jgi:hypothetical protein
VSRIRHHHASPTRQALIRATAGTAAAASLVLAVAACGSASSQTQSQSSSAVSLGTVVQQDCTTVADVLSDGPDPGADPVGYAQAQVLPLRQLTIGDTTLRSAVLSLATAYEKYSTSSGSTRAAAALVVTKAENEVNKICPQAAQ